MEHIAWPGGIHKVLGSVQYFLSQSVQSLDPLSPCSEASSIASEQVEKVAGEEVEAIGIASWHHKNGVIEDSPNFSGQKAFLTSRLVFRAERRLSVAHVHLFNDPTHAAGIAATQGKLTNHRVWKLATASVWPLPSSEGILGRWHSVVTSIQRKISAAVAARASGRHSRPLHALAFSGSRTRRSF